MSGFFNAHSYEKNTKKKQRITHCGKCGLSKKCISPKMEVAGSGKRKILFIGDHPGQIEDREGILFQGNAGQFLRETLDCIGIDIDDCLMTNAVICHPVNKLEPFMPSCCRPSLLQTIKKFQPNVIIPLGPVAFSSLVCDLWKKDNIESITRWAGWQIPSRDLNAYICPTFHPSYLLQMKKEPVLVSYFTQHLEKALKLCNETLMPYPPLSELEKQVEIVTETAEAEKKLLKLANKKGIVAFDYETTGLKPDRKQQKLISASFCYEGKETFAFMMKSGLESSIRKVLRAEKLKKVASNIKFEERWSIAKLNTRVRSWDWDTMLMAHYLDNRSKIYSVKFQAFVLLGIPNYDEHIHPYLVAKFSNGLNNIRDLDEKDLLLYNGLDSLLEFLVMKEQKKIIKRNIR